MCIAVGRGLRIQGKENTLDCLAGFSLAFLFFKDCDLLFLFSSEKESNNKGRVCHQSGELHRKGFFCF